MTTLRKVQLAIAEYRPSLTEAGGRVPLAVVVGATLGGESLVALSNRTRLSDAEAGRLGGLARQLLANPTEYFQTMVEATLKPGQAPAATLGVLSDRNASSLVVTAPRELQVNVRLDEGGDLGTVAVHIANHALLALMRGEDPFRLSIRGHSGTLRPQAPVEANGIAPEVAAWAMDRSGADWRNLSGLTR